MSLFKITTMKLGKILTISGAVLSLCTTVQAQDIHYSQFYAAPLSLNPAATGVMPCDMRVTGIYRNQWASVMGAKAYNTFGASIDGKLNVGSSNDHVGIGLNIMADKAGASKFSTINVVLSASYLKRVGGRRSNEHYLVAGAQVGMGQRSINLQDLTFGTQWGGDQFDGSLPTLENIAGLRKTFADLNAGIMWFSALDKKNKSNVYGGVAFSHLTRANISHLQEGFHYLYSKFTVHFGGEFRLGDRSRLALVPAAAWWLQGPTMELNVGTGVKFDFSKRAQSNQAFQIGVWSRFGNNFNASNVDKPKFGTDAIIVAARMRFGSSNFGLSYDVNISKLRAASRGNGAFELSYIYTLCGGRGKPMGCPTF